MGKLNQLLPKRQFILIGPGRWGSRGDIKLGVPVTYSDINNTSVLLEVARRKGNGYSKSVQQWRTDSERLTEREWSTATSNLPTYSCAPTAG